MVVRAKCPSCGEESVRIEEAEFGGEKYYCVACSRHYCGLSTGAFKHLDYAVSRWNSCFDAKESTYIQVSELLEET